MKPTYDFLASELRKQHIRLSQHRVRVLNYLCQNRIHPTVDQIYMAIQSEVPGLSKTTVYNTLHTLEEACLVRIINIEDHEVRYDINTENHGHFKCKGCGAIFDFKTDPDLLNTDDLTGFQILDKNIYFKGICPKCRRNSHSQK
jgi:Fur family peroxide stress response transcriptional regulator